jgi:hypothetical protein
MSKIIFEFKVGAFHSDEFSCENEHENYSEVKVKEQTTWSITNLLGSFAGKRNPTKATWTYRYTLLYCIELNNNNNNNNNNATIDCRPTQSQVSASPSGLYVAYIQVSNLRANSTRRLHYYRKEHWLYIPIKARQSIHMTCLRNFVYRPRVAKCDGARNRNMCVCYPEMALFLSFLGVAS